MNPVAIVVIILIACAISGVVVYLMRERGEANVELDRLLGNEYRACLAIKAGSGGYFYERHDGRFVWSRI